jgi:hypothetical protein
MSERAQQTKRARRTLKNLSFKGVELKAAGRSGANVDYKDILLKTVIDMANYIVDVVDRSFLCGHGLVAPTLNSLLARPEGTQAIPFVDGPLKTKFEEFH